jgi:hypothetical protein
MNFKEIGFDAVEWIHIMQIGTSGRTVMNLQVP